MATKPTKTRRAAPRKRRKPPPSDKPKRHAWTRQDGEIHGPGYKIGYARVSTLDQNLALQQDALKEAGCEKIFIEQMSGAVSDRPALREALDYARSGDTLDCLEARPPGAIHEAAHRDDREAALAQHRLSEPHGGDRHDDGARRPGVSHVQRACRVRARPHPGAHTRRTCRSEARGPNRRPTAEADRGRSRHCEDVARQSRYYRRRCCRPSRRVARYALPVSACRQGCQCSTSRKLLRRNHLLRLNGYL